MKSRLPALVFLALALAEIFGGASSARAGSVSIRPVCGAVPLGYARCFSLVKGNATAAAPSGYGPADLQSAYKLPSATAGSGQTVAIVDAFDDPTAESDLAQYRSFYGLPPCTTANGCFRKVNETGGTNYPAPSPDWALENPPDPGLVSAVPHRRGRDVAHAQLVEPRLDRVGVERGGKRLQRLRREAFLADRHRMCAEDGVRRLRRRRPEHRRRGSLRRSLVDGGRHERLVADRRERLRAGRKRVQRHLRLVSLLAYDRPVRRGERQQRLL